MTFYEISLALNPLLLYNPFVSCYWQLLCMKGVANEQQ